MVDPDANAKSTDESGIKSVQDKETGPRILPYYCSWYRSIFPRNKAELPASDIKKPAYQTTND